MKPNRKGDRHPLLFYRRTMDRVWIYTLILTILLAAVGRWSLLRETIILGLSSEIWFEALAFLSFVISISAFLGRYSAYVQATESSLNLATPFLRIKISFRRLRSVHPVLVQQLFPPAESRWAQRNYLAPFYGKTALVVEMRGYPMSTAVLRLFLPKPMFSPRSTGFVIVVSDWMRLSTELDSFYGAWLQAQGARARAGKTLR